MKGLDSNPVLVCSMWTMYKKGYLTLMVGEMPLKMETNTHYSKLYARMCVYNVKWDIYVKLTCKHVYVYITESGTLMWYEHVYMGMFTSQIVIYLCDFNLYTCVYVHQGKWDIYVNAPCLRKQRIKGEHQQKQKRLECIGINSRESRDSICRNSRESKENISRNSTESRESTKG